MCSSMERQEPNYDPNNENGYTKMPLDKVSEVTDKYKLGHHPIEAN